MAALKLLSVNLHLESNCTAHHTDGFERTQELIVRRGTPFTMALMFNRPVQPTDTILFAASMGAQPSESNGTKVTVPVSSSKASGSWSAVPEPGSSNLVTISITSPADAIVGRYKMGFIISSRGFVTSHRLKDFVLLFNTWAPEDSVYLPDEKLRTEYVLSEHGIIFYGNVNNIGHTGWNFGQFEKDILKIALVLMDKNSTTDHAKRRDPAYITRVFSALINSYDDKGVLIGNWSGEYIDEEDPSRWNGSVEILRKWMASGPVRYGQCWVFAGVMCTVLRCLGIPTRVITNFNSAHDTNENLSIDVFYDTTGKHLGGNDSVWNFHVWNECWFKRKDLGPAYDGWQVLDATPQEESAGIYQLGPASVNAIKNGDIHLPYDCPFVLSEMNADRISWVYDELSGKVERIHTDTKTIGQFASTKAVGRNAQEDVTSYYKHKEGSPEERLMYKKALNVLFGSVMKPFAAAAAGTDSREAARAPEVEPAPEVSGKFKKIPPPIIGQDINLVLTLKNNTSAAKAVKVNINAAATTYTRKEMQPFMNTSHSITLGGNEEKDVAVNVPYTLYQTPLTRDNVIEVTALCQIGQGGKVLVTENINLKTPSVDIKIVGPVVLNEKAKVEVTFTNPLSEELKNCEMHAEGSGLIETEIVQMLSMKPKQTMSIPLEFIPYKKGDRQLQINIKGNKFLNIKGFENINVEAAS